MSVDNETINDAKLYRQLQEPFESTEAANEAITKFFAEFRELRAKYKMPDTYIIVMVNTIDSEGHEGQSLARAHNGGSMNAETMVAWALGQEQAYRQEKIAEILSAGGRRRNVSPVRK